MFKSVTLILWGTDSLKRSTFCGGDSSFALSSDTSNPFFGGSKLNRHHAPQNYDSAKNIGSWSKGKHFGLVGPDLFAILSKKGPTLTIYI